MQVPELERLTEFRTSTIVLSEDGGLRSRDCFSPNPTIRAGEQAKSGFDEFLLTMATPSGFPHVHKAETKISSGDGAMP